MVRIQDGAGGGNEARVSELNRLSVNAVSQPQDRAVNERLGKVWSVPFKGIDPAGADDYFLYIKNTGTVNIRVTDVRISSTVAGIVEVQRVSGDAAGGTDIVAVGRNFGIEASLNAQTQSGTDITGLTNEGVLFFVGITAANGYTQLSTSSRIIIPPNTAMALLWPESTGILTGVVSVVEETTGNTNF